MTDDDKGLIADLEATLPPVVFTFLQNVNNLHHVKGYQSVEVTAAMVAECWNDALAKCETVLNLQLATFTTYDADMRDAMVNAGLLK